jgi:lipoprotein-anchoring transpeptidase ErfK/SrfK
MVGAPCAPRHDDVDEEGPLVSTSAQRRLLPALLALSGLVLAACGAGGLDVHAGTVSPQSGASIVVTPAPTGKPVAPADPLVVRAEAGRLTAVSVVGPDGEIRGELSVDGTTFTVPAGALEYSAQYTVIADAVDRVGVPTQARTTLTTVAPKAFLGYSVSPREGATVGVGMPITLTLDRSLRKNSAKAAFERTLRVEVDGLDADGAWHWVSDRVVQYRPQTYWPGHATIEVHADLKGTRIAAGVWGQKNRTSTFETGVARISYVDIRTLKMKVTEDGKAVRTIPVTTGKEGFETRSGIKVISTKERTRLMDAATGGTDENDPEYYRLEVEYAMRLTNSGEFIHAAPWSVRSQGESSVSHGCTGMSTADARWLYDRSRIGDVVVYSGSQRTMETWNGIGIWNYSWPAWAKGSALS